MRRQARQEATRQARQEATRQARHRGGAAPAAVGADAALLSVALAAGLGLGRLTSSPGSARVVVPIAACVVVGHLAVSLLSGLAARRGVAGAMDGAIGAVGGVVGVALVAGWTLLGSATRAGIPTPTTWHSMRSWFSEAGSVITGGPTPLPATTGVVLCMALGAGLVAVSGRALWAGNDGALRPVPYPMVALAPASGLFAYTALLSSDRGRATATVVFFVAVAWFVAAGDRAVGRGSRRARRAGPRRPVGALGVVLTVVVVAGVTVVSAPALADMHVHAFPHRPSVVAGAGDGSSAGTVALVDDVGATSASDDKSVMFVAGSPIPTYWQVASLAHFDGVEWSPIEGTLGSTLPAPATPTFSATIAVADMSTTLLPAPPDTEKVQGGEGLSVKAGEVESASFTTAGMQYTVTARVPPAPGTGAGSFAALYGAVPPAELAPYLAMPPVGPDIVSLARHIVSGDDTPLAEADALVRWFDSGRFRYTTRTPASTDPDPLSSFLFETHAGFCQQFAGAFAALARLDGLPTRIAVGFSSGSTTTLGVYRVLGGDAHTWPEVYFGPAVGWVSFEPTPGGAGTPPSVRQGEVASAGSPARGLPHDETATTTPGRGPSLADLLPAGSPRPAPARRSAPWTAGIVLAALVVVGGVVALMGRRRTRDRLRGRVRRQWERRWEPMARRRRGRYGLVPPAEILASWHRTGVALERAALGRRPSETPDEHAARLGAAMERRARMSPVVSLSMAPTSHVDVDDYRELAALATKAVYGRDACSDADAERAHDLEMAVRAMLDADATGDPRVPAGV